MTEDVRIDQLITEIQSVNWSSGSSVWVSDQVATLIAEIHRLRALTVQPPTAQSGDGDGSVLGEGLLPEQRAELEEIRAVVAAGHGLGTANSAWLVALVDRLATLLAQARAA